MTDDQIEGIRFVEPTDGERSWWRTMGREHKDDEPRVVEIEFTLRRESDGVERVCRNRWCPFFGDLSTQLRGIWYWHNEGNGGCGCNRHIFFETAGGRARSLAGDGTGDITDDEVRCDLRYTLVAPAWLADEFGPEDSS